MTAVRSGGPTDGGDATGNAGQGTGQPLPERIACVIFGAGHAGLAESYELTQRGVEHIVLERGQIAQTWRSKRWDSFLMIMPNWGMDLPGWTYQGDRDAFTSRDEAVRYFERYAASFNAPVRTGVTVTAVRPAPGAAPDDPSPLLVETDHGTILAGNVVVATGIFQIPRVPEYASQLPDDILQLTPDTYKNPEQCPEGAILVVGTGASGTQIAEDLLLAGRKVYLATGRTGRIPRRYRGIDSSLWARFPGIKQKDEDRAADAGGGAHRTGRGGDRDINLHRFARNGVTLMGHVLGVDPVNPAVLRIKRDLHENLAYADEFDRRWRQRVDDYIEAYGMDLPPAEPRPDDGLTDGFQQPERDCLDLRAEGISTIIWAIGYDHDYSVVKLPVFGEDGHPVHDWGVTSVPGLYFVGMTWRGPRPSSSFIGVVGGEAAYVADHIAARVAAQAQAPAPR